MSDSDNDSDSESPRDKPDDVDPLVAVVDALADEHGMAAVIEERTLRLPQPVKGDPGLTVLRILGVAQERSPVGAAAHGPNGVAIGVWARPELFVARWTNGRRWVVGYKIPGDTKPNAYIRTEGRIPTRLEIGNWYGAVPDAVTEAFFDVGLLPDEPPFPVPRPAPPPPPPSATTRAAARAPRAPRPAAPPKPRPARVDRAPTTRLCPSCRMQKAAVQFVAGSDLCVDCR